MLTSFKCTLSIYYKNESSDYVEFEYICNVIDADSFILKLEESSDPIEEDYEYRATKIRDNLYSVESSCLFEEGVLAVFSEIRVGAVLYGRWKNKKHNTSGLWEIEIDEEF